jgi:predicted DNA-binding WGR domain protein
MAKIPPKERKLDLAPSNRGSCKDCGELIPEGTMRVIYQTNSQWHDGFEDHAVHPTCGHGVKDVSMIANLGEMRYGDQLLLLEHIGHKVSKNAVGGEQNQLCDRVWAKVDELLAHNKKKEMTSFMEYNGLRIERVAKAKNKYELAYEVADALCFGKPGACPVCDGVGTLRSSFSATEQAPTVRCHGLVGGTTKCEFGRNEPRVYGAAGVRREKVEIPPDLFKKKTFFKDYELPAAVAALPGGPPAASASAAAAAAPAAAAAGKKKRKNSKNAAGAGEGAGAAAAPPKRTKLKGNEESLQVHAEAPQGKIYVGEGGTCAYNVTLAQADLGTGVNKFYILQLLEKSGGGYSFWTKWGRTGETGKQAKGKAGRENGTMVHDFDDASDAIKDFEKKCECRRISLCSLSFRSFCLLTSF